MKKFLILISLLGIVSCKPADTSDVQLLDSERAEIRTSANFNYVLDYFRFDIDGHTYIGIDGCDRMNGIVHDPDCLKCKEQRDEQNY